MLQRAGDPCLIGDTLGCHAAFAVERLARRAIHVIVEQRVAGPGIAGDQGIGAIDVGDIGDAADINHYHRAFALKRLGERAVIDGYEGCALPAGSDIGGAEIMHDRDMDGLGECSCIADLHGHLLRRPMQHGLAVKADDIDVLAREAVLRGKGGHRFGMRDRHRVLGLAQDARPRIALRQVNRFRQGLAQQPTLVLGVGPIAGWPKRLHAPAIGFDQGDIDPVERGAAHQTDCRQDQCHGASARRPCPRRPACVKQAHLIMPQRARLRQPIPPRFRNSLGIT